MGLKLWGGIIALAIIAGFLGWVARIDHLRATYKAQITHLVGVVAEVSGVPKLKVKDSPAAVRRIGADRDTYYSNWQSVKSSLQTQTNRVIDLGKKRDAAIAEADRARAQVASLKAQRDGWIKKAQAASTRTQRRSAEAEVAECQATMDALYQAGF
jgi:hypothetical protein